MIGGCDEVAMNNGTVITVAVISLLHNFVSLLHFSVKERDGSHTHVFLTFLLAVDSPLHNFISLSHFSVEERIGGQYFNCK